MFKPVKKLNETFEYFVIYDIFRNFYILIESSISPAHSELWIDKDTKRICAHITLRGKSRCIGSKCRLIKWNSCKSKMLLLDEQSNPKLKKH